MALYIGKNHSKNDPVQSIFRLVGNDEDALTYALGFLLAHDFSLCAKLVRYLRVAYRRPLKPDYSVHLQEVTGTGYGRRDIVIEDERLRIVLEAKVGRAEPTTEQLTKYAEEGRLWSKYTTRAVVALTQGELFPATKAEVKTKLSNRGIKFSTVQWHEVIDLVLSHRPSDGTEVSRYLYRQFIRYVRRDYQMGYYDAEILIQDLNADNAGIFEEGWMYVTSLGDKRSPLYFAPYYTRQNTASGIAKISRVVDTEIAVLAEKLDLAVEPPTDEHKQKWLKGLALLRKRAEKERFDRSETRLLYLDRPLTLWAPPLTKESFNQTAPNKRIPSQIPKGFHLRFDELLGHPPK